MCVCVIVLLLLLLLLLPLLLLTTAAVQWYTTCSFVEQFKTKRVSRRERATLMFMSLKTKTPRLSITYLALHSL